MRRSKAKRETSAKINAQHDDDPITDAISSDEQMSGIGAASGDDESGSVTSGNADCFHTVSGRTAQKKRKGKPAPGGVYTVLLPIQEPPATVNLDVVDPLALVTHLLDQVENDQLVGTATSLFQQLKSRPAEEAHVLMVSRRRDSQCGQREKVSGASKKLIQKGKVKAQERSVLWDPGLSSLGNLFSKFLVQFAPVVAATLSWSPEKKVRIGSTLQLFLSGIPSQASDVYELSIVSFVCGSGALTPEELDVFFFFATRKHTSHAVARISRKSEVCSSQNRVLHHGTSAGSLHVTSSDPCCALAGRSACVGGRVAWCRWVGWSCWCGWWWWVWFRS